MLAAGDHAPPEAASADDAPGIPAEMTSIAMQARMDRPAVVTWQGTPAATKRVRVDNRASTSRAAAGNLAYRR